MTSFPSNLFYLKNKTSYLGINNEKNELNCHTIICTQDQPTISNLWYYDSTNKCIKHHQTDGCIIQKYEGWMPYRSNVLLQLPHDYDIEINKLSFQYDSNDLFTNINDKCYRLSLDNDKNVVLQEGMDGISNEKWDIIEQ